MNNFQDFHTDTTQRDALRNVARELRSLKNKEVLDEGDYRLLEMAYRIIDREWSQQQSLRYNRIGGTAPFRETRH